MRFSSHIFFFIWIGFAALVGSAWAEEKKDLSAIPCDTVTLDYNSRQRWEPGFSQYRLPYEAWTAQAFDILRERAVACSNPDAQSFIAYITYLEGINADALEALDDNRRQQALAEVEAKRKAELEAERALKQQQAAEEAERKRLAEEEAERVREQQQAAEAAERQHQAELEASALLEDHEPQPKVTAIAEPQPANPMFPLDKDVRLFVQQNGLMRLTAEPSENDVLIMESIMRNQAVILLALELCDERWSDFPGYLEEAQRRTELLNRVRIQFFGFPPDKMMALRESADQVFVSTQARDYLLADLNGLYEVCQRSLLEIAQGLNFAQ